MHKRIWSVVATALGLFVAATNGLAAYPDKPIQLIVPYGAGGSTDLLARAIATVAPKYFPQPLVVVNKGGGGGIPGRVDVVRVQAGRLHAALRLGLGRGPRRAAPAQAAL